MSSEMSYQTVLATEIEAVFALPGSADAARSREDHFQLVNGADELGQPTPVREMAAEMHDYYQALRPASDQERERQREWLSYVQDNVTPSDVVNFKVYRELSQPSLTYFRPPVGATYSQVIEQSGKLEFRGPGIYQEGWYDYPGISEMRVAPTPSEQHKVTRSQLLHRIAAIATSEGHYFYNAKEDTNGSIFAGEAPLLLHELDAYVTAVAGLRRVFVEGALFNPDVFPRYYSEIAFGQQRVNKVRVMPGRIEARGIRGWDGPGYDNLALLLDAGLRYGFGYATEEEKNAIFTSDVLQATPQAGYHKQEHLQIKRAIEACTLDSDPEVQGQNYYVLDSSCIGREALGALTGKQPDLYSHNLYESFFTYGVTLTDEGYLQTNEALMRTVMGRHPNQKHFGLEDIDRINAQLRLFKVTAVKQVVHRVYGLSSTRALNNLETATALPAVAPNEYAQLRRAMQGKQA